VPLAGSSPTWRILLGKDYVVYLSYQNLEILASNQIETSVAVLILVVLHLLVFMTVVALKMTVPYFEIVLYLWPQELISD
jgi:hypothetical protein